MINIDTQKLTDNYTKIQTYLQFYDNLGAPLVSQYSKDLDEKVDQITKYINQIKQFNLDYDLVSLQRMSLELSTTLYYTSSKLEQVSLMANMAKIDYKSKYNEAYTSKQEATTVDKRKWTTDQLKATAEQEAIEEELVNFIYDHVEEELKAKIDSGYELLKIISKNLSAQIQQMQQFGYSQKG